MACSPLSHEVSDLTLGKRALFCLPLSISIASALQALKQRDEPEISVWDCTPASHLPHSSDVDSVVEGALKGAGAWHRHRNGECQCIGKVCMQNIICYLAKDESLINLPKALRQPLSVLFKETTPVVQHIDAAASISDALSLMVDGIQNLVVPISSPIGKFRKNAGNGNKIVQKSKSTGHGSSISTSHNGRDYCWLTQEDMMRFLLGFIGMFSPLPMMNIEDLGVIKTNVLMVEADKAAISALDIIVEASHQMSAVAVVENDDGIGPKLIGDISPSTLQNCDETAALALATLTAGDFLLYIRDCKNPPEKLVNEVRVKVLKKLRKGDFPGTFNLQQMASSHNQDMEVSESSSDEELADSPTGHHQLAHRWSSASRSSYGTTFFGKARTAPIICHPWSSLVAVLLQALAHRENYVWVVDGEGILVGIVTFSAIAYVLFEHLSSRT